MHSARPEIVPCLWYLIFSIALYTLLLVVFILLKFYSILSIRLLTWRKSKFLQKTLKPSSHPSAVHVFISLISYRPNEFLIPFIFLSFASFQIVYVFIDIGSISNGRDRYWWTDRESKLERHRWFFVFVFTPCFDCEALILFFTNVYNCLISPYRN